MLCLDRNIKESIIVNEDIRIMIINFIISKDFLSNQFINEEEQIEAIKFFKKLLPGIKVRLGVKAPKNIRIIRSELSTKDNSQLSHHQNNGE